ncbi:two-component system CitB family sensor kinase [Rhodoglobus vestalii]|uniref:histidine kinase n=1 Tax=Rhodoglobus vestalii TaxID=193384 RepID=A0A8H2PT71_9MICO|nr:sensor histidine kinase [Rhodoglobus vestalii]TQO18936.1 two-component system CitB family sensor kinase [Rhodoglobus vestalii]
MKLRTQLLLLQLAIVLFAVIGTGIMASWLQEQQLRDSYRDRMIAVAQSVATLPAIIGALDDHSPSTTIQPIAEVVREASDVTYVVVTDDTGIRYSHPNPERIGKPVSTDPSIALAGDIYVGTQTGTLGESWRVKVPIVNDDDVVVGVVSVGILEAELRSDYFGYARLLFLTIGIAATIGVVGAAWISSLIRRRIYGLEPDEIVGLLEAREAMLHGIREGVVAFDERGRVALINDAGEQLLDLTDADNIGRPAEEVLNAELIRMLDGDNSQPRLVLCGERVLLVHCDKAQIDERSLGAVFILRDNTELHALMRDLDGANSFADVLRSQAHGFANKLHVISGLLELGYSAEAVAFIERVGDGGTLSSAAAGTGIRDLEIAALLLVKQSRALEHGIAVSVDEKSLLAPLTGDAEAELLRDDLLTVIGNLVDNAIEACGSGASIRITIIESAAELLVRIIDTGPGVASELHETVFTPGYSSKAPPHGRQLATRGIGLTLVRRIARRHGGDAQFVAGVASGAEVIVQFPRSPSPVPEKTNSPKMRR